MTVVISFLVGFFLGFAASTKLDKLKRERKKDQKKQKEEYIDVKVGQLWIDIDWNDTVFKIVEIHETKPLVRIQYLEIDGEDTSGSSKLEMELNRHFFKNYKLLRDVEETEDTPNGEDDGDFGIPESSEGRD